jgi:hypothetical protein
MYDCYLRPYELLGLRARDVIAPSEVLAHWCIRVCPREELRPSKTGIFDDTVILDSKHRPAALFMLLLLLRSKVFEPGDLLFEFSHESLLKLFQKALEWLSLPGWGFSLYSCRHGGPSEDVCGNFRSLEVVKRRGRWASESSLRRYEQRGRLHVVYSHVPRQLMSFCISIEKNFEALVLNQVSLQKPGEVSHPVPAALPLED